MPPAPINMSNIAAALAARAGGNGIPMPALGQMTQPSASLPTGGANTPMPMPMPTPTPGTPPPADVGQRMGGANPTQQMAQVGQQAQSPLLDPETRDIAKVLVQKLIKHM